MSFFLFDWKKVFSPNGLLKRADDVVEKKSEKKDLELSLLEVSLREYYSLLNLDTVLLIEQFKKSKQKNWSENEKI